MTFKLNNYIKKISFIFSQLLKSGPWFLFFVFFAVLINGLSPVFTAFMVSKVISVFEGGTQDTIVNQYFDVTFLIIIMFSSVVLTLFTNNIKSIISELTSHRLSYSIQTIVAAKFQKIPQFKIDTPEFQNLYKNTTEKVLTEPVSVAESLFGLISCGISLLGYISIISTLNVLSVILVLGLSVPIYFLKGKSKNLEFDFLKDYTTEIRQIYYNYYLMTDSQLTKEIRTLSLFDYLKDKRDIAFEKLMLNRNKIAKKKIIYLILTTFLSIIGAIFTEFVLVHNVIHGIIPVSMFVLYNSAITSLVVGLFTFIDLSVTNSRNLQFIDYLFEFLDLKTENNKNCSNCSLIINQPNYEIEFSNVSFKYPGATKNSVEDVSFRFKTGQKICLVGENGSGKSTLVKLLLRIYDPIKGDIFINGKNIKSYDLEEYRKLFGIIFQDFIRYLATVKENIGFGNVKEINNIEKIKKTSQKTNSSSFIENYKDGYNTNLGKSFYDDAIEPSGGQWQKLAITRAFFPESKILVLDEPTSSLDPKSEDEIFKIFHTCENQKAILIISHRMCSARLADKIVLLSDGKILESGSHSELMKKKQNYYEMYTLQAEKYTDK